MLNRRSDSGQLKKRADKKSEDGQEMSNVDEPIYDEIRPAKHRHNVHRWSLVPGLGFSSDINHLQEQFLLYNGVELIPIFVLFYGMNKPFKSVCKRAESQLRSAIHKETEQG